MGSHFHKLSTASLDQDAQTPRQVLRLVRELYLKGSGARLFDPCPPSPTRDGLEVAWGRFNYVNPPFGQVRRWMEKALSELRARGSCSVFLVPARTHTKWFAEVVFPRARQVVFLTNRIGFRGYAGTFPLPLLADTCRAH
jgi:hypothetical protein